MRLCPRCRRTFPDEGVRFCPYDGAALDAGAPADGSYENRILAERYRVFGRLASGEMGAVYLGQDMVSKAEVAIRFIPGSRLSDPGIRERLDKRLERARSIRHPHLLSVLDHGPLEETGLFVVTERVEGRTLREAMQEFGPFPPELALAILDQILSGLAEAHRAGLVHGNVNPSNVLLLTRENAPGRYVKVMDLGVMKLLRSVDARETEGETTRVTGDPNYIAPEQVAGVSADHRSDLYAAGLLAFRMVSGRLPFERWTERVAGDARQVPAALRSVPLGRWHLPLERLFVRVLAADPGRRFRSADEFRRAAAGVVKSARRTNRLRTAVFCASILGVGGYFFANEFWLPSAEDQGPVESGPLVLWTAPAEHETWVAALAAKAGRPDLAGMAAFDAGSVLIGNDAGDDDEHPRAVTLPAFHIDRRPVTRAEYAAFREATGAAAPADWPDGKLPAGTGDQPVTGLSWYLAEAYAAWRGKVLPTDAMWERATAGGALEFGPAFEWTATPHERLAAHRILRLAGDEPWQRNAFYAHGSRSDLGFRCAYVELQGKEQGE